MRKTILLSLTTIALSIYANDSHAEFPGDPGLGGPTLACKYYHTERNKIPLASDIYKSVLVSGTKCPKHDPQEGPLHTVTGNMKVTNPHYSMIKSTLPDVTVVLVDTHLCAVTTQSTPVPSNGN
jgi:hypothetical protein